MGRLLRESQTGSPFVGEHVDVVSSSSHDIEDPKAVVRFSDSYGASMSAIAKVFWGMSVS
jgi:hypothetical protein